MGRKMDEIKEIAQQASFDAHEALSAAGQAQSEVTEMSEKLEYLQADMVKKLNVEIEIQETMNDALEKKI